MGNKNSGRRPNSVRVNRLAAIDKAWLRSVQSLDGKELKAQQFDMAKSIVVKSIPEQHDVNLNINEIMAERIKRARQRVGRSDGQ